jgi:hypothetical protein
VADLRPALACFDTGEVRLSPDGTLAAIVYGVVSADRTDLIETRLAVVDVATGAIRLDGLAGPYEKYAEFQPIILGGMAWTDAHTLRVAVTKLPASPTRVPVRRGSHHQLYRVLNARPGCDTAPGRLFGRPAGRRGSSSPARSRPDGPAPVRPGSDRHGVNAAT